MSQKQALGRGLEALMQDSPAFDDKETLLWLNPDVIAPNPLQPRLHFDEEALAELAHSIVQHGLLQPLLVQEKSDGKGYELVAGERRLRASKKAGLAEVPCRLLSLETRETLEIALLENIQRDDLNALEEAQGYQLLIERFSYTQEELAKRLGKSRSHITNRLRLLSLPDALKTMVREEKLSAGHAKVLLSSKDPLGLATEVLSKKLSVRETEQRVRSPQTEGSQEADVLAEQLTTLVGHQVRIQHNARGVSSLSVIFETIPDLETFIERLHSAFGQN